MPRLFRFSPSEQGASYVAFLKRLSFRHTIGSERIEAAETKIIRRPDWGPFMIEPDTNVVAFKPRSSVAHHPKSLMERVYAAGSLALRADDRATKTAAVMLQALGFLVIEEITADGAPRRLQRGEAKGAMDRPWRLSKPAYSGTIGVPDGGGAVPS